jgi:hypothetical protein
MTVSYKFCLIKRFSESTDYYKPMQLTIENTEEEAECSFKTSEKPSLEYIKDELITEVPDISVDTKLPEKLSAIPYDVYIDMVVNKKGKVFHSIFYKYLEPNEFVMYHLKEINMMLFAGTQKDVATHFIKEINSDPSSGLELEEIEVDFKSLQPLIPVIIGVWFGDMNKQYLKSAGYFGRHVDKSEEFIKALEDEAEISQLMFDYMFNGQQCTVAVTKKGAVVLYSRIKDSKTKIPDIESEIQLASQIFSNFVLPGLKAKSSS